jgi:HlyD family secretion protein
MEQPVKKIAAAAVVIAVLTGAIIAWNSYRNNGDKAESFQTTEVTRGDLAVTISATGTVEPEEVVDVGAQVQGEILSFGKDVNGHTVDYGSEVAAGTVLANIDEAIYKSAVDNAKAQEQASEANLQRTEADLEQYKAKLNQTERDWQRAQKIGPSEALSQSSYDGYLSNYETAKSNVAVAQAVILQAKASLAQSKAQLASAMRNLGYCTITSPVKGVIIDRRVNIGETVVSSLNAPSLFLIAKDLTRMQVWVSVNEADIGKIKPGQPVSFTVDAFPGETFKGTVGKIRLNASMTQNVVTYTVEIITGNKDGRLLPYLTANAQFEIQHMKDVLRVPNAALRWTPNSSQISPQYTEAMQQRRQSGGQTYQGRQSDTKASQNSDSNRKRLWIADGSYVKPVWVSTGITDGIITEVEGKDLTEGMQVVTGVKTRVSGTSDTKNPFAVNINRRTGVSSSTGTGAANQQSQQSR